MCVILRLLHSIRLDCDCVSQRACLWLPAQFPFHRRHLPPLAPPPLRQWQCEELNPSGAHARAAGRDAGVWRTQTRRWRARRRQARAGNRVERLGEARPTRSPRLSPAREAPICRRRHRKACTRSASGGARSGSCRRTRRQICRQSASARPLAPPAPLAPHPPAKVRAPCRR